MRTRITSRHIIPAAVFVLAAAYYCALAAKGWTWIFVSGDSGDWLAASTWWIVPQPLGSPLYIALGHLLNTLPGDLPLKMTIILSCLPSAITVATVYAIADKLTAQRAIAAAAALVTLGAATLLSQSTVIEEYALTTMFITLAVWAYVGEWRCLTALALGLATAVSAVTLPVAALWLISERRQWRQHLKPAAVYLVSGIGPYALILILMAAHTPPLLADYFSVGGVFNYTTGTSNSIIGQIALVDIPKRLLVTAGLLAMNMGLALVPLLFIRRPLGSLKLPVIIVAFFVVYFATNLDPVTWTFLSMAIPSLAVIAGVGLSRMRPAHVKAVAAGAGVLLAVNCAFMNANLIEKSDGSAAAFADEMRAEVPAGSVVLCSSGRFSLGTFYMMTQGFDVTPVINWRVDCGYWPDYREWLAGRGLAGNSTAEIISGALDRGQRVFVIGTQWDQTQKTLGHWEDMIECSTFKEDASGYVRELDGFSLLQWLYLQQPTTQSAR